MGEVNGIACHAMHCTALRARAAWRAKAGSLSLVEPEPSTIRRESRVGSALQRLLPAERFYRSLAICKLLPTAWALPRIEGRPLGVLPSLGLLFAQQPAITLAPNQDFGRVCP